MVGNPRFRALLKLISKGPDTNMTCPDLRVYKVFKDGTFKDTCRPNITCSMPFPFVVYKHKKNKGSLKRNINRSQNSSNT